MALSIEYIAGLFDGEGCIGPVIREKRGKRTAELHVAIVMTDEQVIRQLWAQYPEANFCTPRGVLGHKQPYKWALTAKNSKHFLQDVAPFLIVKQPQALLALEFIACLRTRQENSPLTQKECNQRLTLAARIQALNQGRCDV
jgi:hypothetical protein